jgi:hypothetical protein
MSGVPRLVIAQADADAARATARGLATSVRLGIECAGLPRASDLVLLLAPGARAEASAVADALAKLAGGSHAAAVSFAPGEGGRSLAFDLVARGGRVTGVLAHGSAALACDAAAAPGSQSDLARAAVRIACALEVERAPASLAAATPCDANDLDALALEGLRSFALEDLVPALRRPDAQGALDTVLDLVARLLANGCCSAGFTLGAYVQRLRTARDHGLPIAPQVSPIASAEPPRAGARVPPAEPLVSLIVPTFSRPALLGRALASVAAQTFGDLEVIVVDDAGADPTGVVALWQGAIGGGGRTTLVRHDRNRGLAAARNTGLRLARGRWVGFLDDDDCLLPNHLAALVPTLRLGSRVAYADARSVWETPAEPLPFTHRQALYHQFGFERRRFLTENYIPVQSVLCERALLFEAGPFDERLPVLEDWDLWIRVFTRTPPVHVPRVTSEVRRRGAANMTTYARAGWLATQAHVYAKSMAEEERDPLLRETRLRYLTEKAGREGVPFPADATEWLRGRGALPPLAAPAPVQSVV